MVTHGLSQGHHGLRDELDAHRDAADGMAWSRGFEISKQVRSIHS